MHSKVVQFCSSAPMTINSSSLLASIVSVRRIVAILVGVKCYFLQFQCVFIRWLMILSTFSNNFIYLLLWSISSNLVHIFNKMSLILLLACMYFSYSLYVRFVIQVLQIFSPILLIAFHFLNIFICLEVQYKYFKKYKT